jgi:hypothetical protein
MAKFNSGIIGSISGSIGGTEFVKSNKGDYIRIKSNPVNTWTPARERVKHRMAKAVRAWSLITYEQSIAWADFAFGLTKTDKVGKIIPYSNRDIFIKVNCNLLEINMPVILSPPEKVYPQQIESVDAEIFSVNGIDDIKLSFNPQIHNSTKIIVYSTYPLKPGVFKVKPCWYKKIAVLDSSFISGSSIIKDYKTVFPHYSLKSARIGILFRPVSAISGFDKPSTEIQVANIQPSVSPST